ncbi:hypothetical protein KKA15_04290 [Patescibacteria group bacterium]|nr:hypothetical protein [Patescibacteria group bacterium]
MENVQTDAKESKGTSKSAAAESSADRTKKKMSKLNIVILAIVIIIIWFIGVQIMAAETYNMVVNVKAEENIMGINPLDIALDFGDLSQGLGATRYVALKNSSEKDRNIIVWMRGEIKGMVDLDKSNFTLVPNEETKLEFKLLVPPSAEPKQYKGKATVFMWPKFW